MSETDAYSDVVELCALLQCLGFSVRSLETSDGNLSQDGGSRTVVVNCQASGLHVVLENANPSCSCPTTTNHQNSGFWQVSGVTGGKQFSKECGSALLGSLPKAHRDRLSKELQDIMRCIKDNNESDLEKPKSDVENKSASMTELKTPEKKNFKLHSETPTRCRSLDTLTATKEQDQVLPAPRPLQKDIVNLNNDAGSKTSMCQRQSTYTLSSSSGSIRRRNKTSSPIQDSQNSILENLIAAEKIADELRSILANVIKDVKEDNKHESSISSLTLDVSKISVMKGAENSKIQFSSSPNLSGMVTSHSDFSKQLKRTDSASTSNLASSKIVPKEGKMSKLRRISPNMFKLRNNTNVSKSEKDKAAPERNSKLNSLFKPRIVTPVRIIKTNTESSPNISVNRKKFTNIKSTIPRPASRKE